MRLVFGNGVVVALLAGAAVVAVELLLLGGARYFATPLGVRGYDHAHRLLRPSGPVGQLLGTAGSVLMLMTLLYVARKRVRSLSRLGAPRAWLEFHVFCGLFGPILVSLHTTFKFNGLVSVAYWSMVLVVLSGFVGRYLFARIPKTIRGEEMTRAQLDARVAELRRAIDTAGPDPEALREARRLERERATLERRIAVLTRTKRLFAMWHVFHLPLVWILFVVFVLHVVVVSYLGYGFLSH